MENITNNATENANVETKLNVETLRAEYCKRFDEKWDEAITKVYGLKYLLSPSYAQIG